MFKTGLAFILGAAAGSIATWYVVRNYYDQVAKEAIDAYRERAFSESTEEEDEEEVHEEIVRPSKKPDLKEYAAKIGEAGYSAYFKAMTGDETEEDNFGEPIVISPDEFASNDEYETISLIYYTDGVLTDDQNNIIEDIEGTVGSDALSRFGEYEDDSVHVVDDENYIYYEILADPRKFSDVVSSDEHPMEE